MNMPRKNMAAFAYAVFFFLFVPACEHPDLVDGEALDTALATLPSGMSPAPSVYTFYLPPNPTGLCWGALRLTATAQGGGKIISVRPAGGDTYTTAAGVNVSLETWYWRGNGGVSTFDKDYTSWNAVTYPASWTVRVEYTGARPRLSYWYFDSNWDCGSP